jgi:hypothetical protein
LIFTPRLLGPCTERHLGFLSVVFKGKVIALGHDIDMAGWETIEPWVETIVDQYLIWSGQMSPSEAKSPRLVEAVDREFDKQIQVSVCGWKSVITERRGRDMAPVDAHFDDLIVVLFGSDVPLVLRRLPTARRHSSFVGPAFAYGIMLGEVMEQPEAGVVYRKSFTIV